jgi:hypothetical protein
MPIVVNLDVMLARRKMRLNELADRVGIRRRIVEGEQNAGLAIEHLAELLERGEPNCRRPACLQHRKILQIADTLEALRADVREMAPALTRVANRVGRADD